MSKKRPKKAPKSPKICAMCTNTPKPSTGRILGYVALTLTLTEFRGHLVHPQPPPFCGFQPSESPNETPRPPYQWSLGGAGGQASPRAAGANGGSTKVPGAKKIIFSKFVPMPLGMLKQVFLGRFEPVETRFGSWKIPKCLENGPFWDQKWVKNG